MTYKTNSRGDLPGPGDFLPPDYSREQALADQVEAMTEEVLEEWINDAEQYADYDARFSWGTWQAIHAAVAKNDATEACRLYRAALREVMHSDAEKEAVKRVAIINSENSRANATARAYGL